MYHKVLVYSWRKTTSCQILLTTLSVNCQNIKLPIFKGSSLETLDEDHYMHYMHRPEFNICQNKWPSSYEQISRMVDTVNMLPFTMGDHHLGLSRASRVFLWVLRFSSLRKINLNLIHFSY